MQSEMVGKQGIRKRGSIMQWKTRIAYVRIGKATFSN
jgi:hypothetical protein